MKLNLLLNPLDRFVSEAGSEQSTHFRGWDLTQELTSPLLLGWT